MIYLIDLPWEYYIDCYMIVISGSNNEIGVRGSSTWSYYDSLHEELYILMLSNVTHNMIGCKVGIWIYNESWKGMEVI